MAGGEKGSGLRAAAKLRGTEVRLTIVASSGGVTTTITQEGRAGTPIRARPMRMMASTNAQPQSARVSAGAGLGSFGRNISRIFCR